MTIVLIISIIILFLMYAIIQARPKFINKNWQKFTVLVALIISMFATVVLSVVHFFTLAG